MDNFSKILAVDCSDKLLSALAADEHIKVVETCTLNELTDYTNYPVVYGGSIEDLHRVLELKKSVLVDSPYIFYIAPESLSDWSLVHIKNCGVNVLSASLGVSNCVDNIVNTLYKVFDASNVFTFFGATRNVGTTHLMHSVALELASKNSTVCCLSLASHINHDYLANCELKDDKLGGTSLDEMKIKLSNCMLTSEELNVAMKHYKCGVSSLDGFSNVLSIRHFSAEMVTYLIRLCSSQFDFVLVDAGAPCDSVCTLGALMESPNRFLISTQNLSCVNTFKSYKDSVLDLVNIENFAIVLNKTVDLSTTLKNDLVGELSCGSIVASVPYFDVGEMCENNYKTFLQTSSAKKYRSSILSILTYIDNYTNGTESKESKLPQIFRLGRR